MPDFDSVKIGVCDPYWVEADGQVPVHLGLTKGGCTVTYTPEFYSITVDQYGTTEVDAVLQGEKVVVTVPMAETDMNKIGMLSPTATVSKTGTTINSVAFGSKPGMRLSAKGKTLILHPISNDGETNPHFEDVIVYRAVNKGALELAYKVDSERVYNVEFSGIIVKGNTNGKMLWEMGDSTAYFTPVAG